jgi:hypothetical protein
MSNTMSKELSNTGQPVRRIARTLAVSSCLAVAVSGVAVSTSAHAAPAEPRAAVQRLQAHLKPGGDPNGSGEAHFTLNQTRGRVCASVEWKNIGKPNAAHIHRGSDGGIVVNLTGSVTGGSHCATGVSKKLIGRILDHPGRYYFNVHNAAYPAGAIQGALRH